MGRERIPFGLLAVAIAACTPRADAPAPPPIEPPPAPSPAEPAPPRWRTDLDAAMDEVLGPPSCTTAHTKALAEMLGPEGSFAACADAMQSVRDELDRMSSYHDEFVPLDDPAWARPELEAVASTCGAAVTAVEDLATSDERCIDDPAPPPDAADPRVWGAYNRAIGLAARLHMRRGDAAASFRTIVAGIAFMQKGCRGQGLLCESLAGATYRRLGEDLEWLLYAGTPTVDALEALDTGLAELQRTEPTPFDMIRVEVRVLLEGLAPKLANDGDAYATRAVENTLIPLLRIAAAEPACRARDRFDECRLAWWGEAPAQPPPSEALGPFETLVAAIQGKHPELLFEFLTDATHVFLLERMRGSVQLAVGRAHARFVKLELEQRKCPDASALEGVRASGIALTVKPEGGGHLLALPEWMRTPRYSHDGAWFVRCPRHPSRKRSP